MGETDKDYELKILKMMINKYLEEMTSISEESLRRLEANSDYIVWELATKIYSQSGHEINLGTVRDVVKSRTEFIEHLLAAEAKQKAQKAEEEARQKAQKAEEEARRVVVQEAYLNSQIERVLAELGGVRTKAQVFVRIQKIIGDCLNLDENKISLISHLSNDLSADKLDLVEIIMGLDEEFDIDISDSEVEDELGIYYGRSGSSTYSLFSSSGLSIDSLESSVATGGNCIVRNFVELIHKKIYN